MLSIKVEFLQVINVHFFPFLSIDLFLWTVVSVEDGVTPQADAQSPSNANFTTEQSIPN